MTLNNTHCAPATETAPRFAAVALAVVGTLIGCSESMDVYLADAESADAGGLLDASVRDSARVDSASIDASREDDAGRPDAGPTMDAGVPADANVGDVPEDAAYIRYERDVRPLLEASACGDCHEGVGIVMDYSWISAPGETWCNPEDYGQRWNCFEEHARTQTVATGQGCDSDFYHRHGEPCFMEEERSQVLRWAADGYRE
jgi:hypothetical protein